MNKSLSTVGRKMLKELLAQCTERQIEMFKLMYGRDNGKRSIEDAKAMNIDDVVDQMPDNKIDWAISQCENTVKKNQEQMKADDFVHYIPVSGFGKSENGRIKTIGEDYAWVVYHCNNEWWRHDDYTGQKTGISNLRPGWIDKDGNPIDTPKEGGDNASKSDNP